MKLTGFISKSAELMFFFLRFLYLFNSNFIFSESGPIPNTVINELQCIPTGRPSWPIRVCAAASTPPPSGRTGALSSQLPFCGRGYSAKAGEGLKQTAKKPAFLPAH